MLAELRVNLDVEIGSLQPELPERALQRIKELLRLNGELLRGGNASANKNSRWVSARF